MKATQVTMGLMCLLGLVSDDGSCQSAQHAGPQPSAVVKGKPIATTPLPSYASAIVFSPDEKNLAIAIDNGAGTGGGWVMFGTADGKNFKKMAEQKLGLASLAFSPDSKRLATACGDGRVALFEVPAGKEQWSKSYKTDRSRYTAHIAFSPDGSTLALLGADDPTVRLYKAADGTLTHKLGDHGEGFVSGATMGLLRYSPDGRFLASTAICQDNCSLRVWEVSTGQELWTFRAKSEHAAFWRMATVNFSLDGRMVAAFGPDMRVWIWERVTGKVRFRFKGDPFLYDGGVFERFGIISGSAYHLAVSPSGKLLAKLTIVQVPDKGPVHCNLDVYSVESLPLKPSSPLAQEMKELDVPKLISRLSGEDATTAYQGVLTLAKYKESVVHLKPKLKAMQSLLSSYREMIRPAVKKLDSSVFAVREKAMQDLKKPAWFYPDLVREAVKEQDLTAEARGRAQKLLAGRRAENIPEEARFLHRVLELLELQATAAAKDILQEVVNAFPPEFSIEAKSSLQRLKTMN
jgi:hypothetical protein